MSSANLSYDTNYSENTNYNKKKLLLIPGYVWLQEIQHGADQNAKL